jgi:TPR repeat protein
LAYQQARALLAKPDLTAARRQFELAESAGYRTAQVDLANLLVDGSAGMLDPTHAVALYEKAWQDGVPIAAYELGRLYETGVAGTGVKFPADQAKAWVWYRKGAEAGEPTALARFGERDERNALAEQDPSKGNALLLEAFRFYAAAAERAYEQDWPDEAWRNWRHRRATLARLLAREGMMSEVAEAYAAIRGPLNLSAAARWKKIKPTLPL